MPRHATTVLLSIITRSIISYHRRPVRTSGNRATHCAAGQRRHPSSRTRSSDETRIQESCVVLREETDDYRNALREHLEADLVVVGGGLAGVCCAVTAARAGARVVLFQDRPVLGGNASSEVRMVVSGATASMANNNRWAREGGVIDEFLVENVFRNPEGNALLSDALLLDIVVAEPNITLLLNTAVFEVIKSDPETISRVVGFCSQNETFYEAAAPLFCDASGDGIVGFLAGAAFRMGAESADEFGEPLAPAADYGELLGHTIYFQSKDVGRPVRFVPPEFALNDLGKITRCDRIHSGIQGRDFWWLEYGGRLDTIHDTETIKWELWRIVYGIWNHIKNSGKFPEAETLTLEWVGGVPGKRESRRFEGRYMLTQNDIVERRSHEDTVSYGGWSLDLHPAGGVYSDRPPCNQWHSQGIYPIPYRAMVSRSLDNLFLAGRNISASHVAFGSTRVMATCAHNAQAVGMAAALCRRHNVNPADLGTHPWIDRLRTELARVDQYIPGYCRQDPDDLAQQATITASSRLKPGSLPANGSMLRLDHCWAMLLPAPAGRFPRVAFQVDAERPTSLVVQLRVGKAVDTYTPQTVLASRQVDLSAGTGQAIDVDFGLTIEEPRYVFVCLVENPLVAVRCSQALVTGVASLIHAGRRDVTAGRVQSPPADLGIDSFEFWHPLAAPQGQLLAIRLEPALDVFGAEAVANGYARPTSQPNAWIADFSDPEPSLRLSWPEPRRIRRVELTFDTDRDNPLFSVLHAHPDRILPQCVRRFRITDADGRVLAHCDDNHQTRKVIRLAEQVTTDQLNLRFWQPSDNVPVAIFEIKCYA
ncbi:MAG: FAD-dependent oxidoreductase [Pirellulales bacterium]|nr:FAD-dependent oxidoreductase [Pirellulales bacterium]